jgi:hypothetical protein
MNELDLIFAEKTIEMAAIYRHVEPPRRRSLLRDAWESVLLGAFLALGVWVALTGSLSLAQLALAWWGGR